MFGVRGHRGTPLPSLECHYVWGQRSQGNPLLLNIVIMFGVRGHRGTPLPSLECRYVEGQRSQGTPLLSVPLLLLVLVARKTKMLVESEKSQARKAKKRHDKQKKDKNPVLYQKPQPTSS